MQNSFTEDVSTLSTEQIAFQLDQIRRAEALQASITHVSAWCDV